MDLLVQTRSAYKENYQLGPDVQIQISVFLDQSESKILRALLRRNEVDYVESDENVSVLFWQQSMRSDCIPSAKNATDPSVVCENAASEF